MKSKAIYLFISIFLFFLLFSIPSQAIISSPSYRITAHSLNGGGSHNTSGSFKNISVIGQSTPIGFSENINHKNKAGFIPQIYTIKLEITLLAGLNIFGYPVTIPHGYTSYDLIAALGTKDEIIRIQRYDSNTNTYQTTYYDQNGNPSGDDFKIVSGEGYIIYMKTDNPISFEGEGIHAVISYNDGLNIISNPFNPYGNTSYDLLLYVGSQNNVYSIQRLNRDKSVFETSTYFFNKPSGTNFGIFSGEGFLIYIKILK